MYKVFFKESCFLLTDNQNLLKEGDIRWVHRDFMTTKNFIYQTLEKGIPFKAVLYDEDPEDLFTIFKSCFTYVKAGGGAVIQNSDILVIKRLGMGHHRTGKERGRRLHSLRLSDPRGGRAQRHLYGKDHPGRL